MIRLGYRALRPRLRSPAAAVAVAVVLVFCAIVLGTRSALAFFSIEGLAIVVGGVIAVAFISYEPADVRKALAVVAGIFKEPSASPPDNLHRDMTTIIAWAYMVKQNGMRRLESSFAKSGIDDPFVTYGLNMMVSGYTAAEVRARMETAADACLERDSVPADVLQTMTSHAPAFGMIGTLVGMVTMLWSLNGEIANIGANLSVAFLSTLYGVVSARMLYMPAAARQRQAVARRRFRNQLITEGMVMLVSNKPPMYIQDHLNSFLPPDRRDYVDQFKIAPQPAPAPAPARLKAVGA